MSSKRHAQYREAAQRNASRYAYKVSPTAHVHIMEDGAFVEVVVWVPKEEADKESGESNELSLPKKL